MATLRNSLGVLTEDQFSAEVQNFKRCAEQLNDISCLQNGLKALSIMFLSLKKKTQRARNNLLEAISILVNCELSQNQLSFGTSDLNVRFEILIESALSHEFLN